MRLVTCLEPRHCRKIVTQIHRKEMGISGCRKAGAEKVLSIITARQSRLISGPFLTEALVFCEQRVAMTHFISCFVAHALITLATLFHVQWAICQCVQVKSFLPVLKEPWFV